MKARSVVLTHIQRPATFGGLPPMMMGFVGAAALFAYSVCVIFRITAIMIPASVVVAAIAYGVAYFVAKRDHHFESVYQNALRFWRTSPCRHLLAGAPPLRCSGRGRS